MIVLKLCRDTQTLKKELENWSEHIWAEIALIWDNVFVYVQKEHQGHIIQTYVVYSLLCRQIISTKHPRGVYTCQMMSTFLKKMWNEAVDHEMNITI